MEEQDEKKGLFEDFSPSSVIASALAAVTSFLLSSKIGLAGSIIGVGVAAAASAMASQIYKAVLSASAEKIKSNLADDAGEPAMTSRLSAEPAEHPSDPTAVRTRPQTLSDETAPHEWAQSGTPIAPGRMRAAAAQRESRHGKRMAVIFTASVAIIAVLIYAAVVNLATSGQGIGSTTALTGTSQNQKPQESGKEGSSAGTESGSDASSSSSGTGTGSSAESSADGSSGTSSADSTRSEDTTSDSDTTDDSHASVTEDGASSTSSTGGTKNDGSNASSGSAEGTGTGGSSSASSNSESSSSKAGEGSGTAAAGN